MALKRINKELADLGRYVSFGLLRLSLAGLLVGPCSGVCGRKIKDDINLSIRYLLTAGLATVTHRLLAPQDLSEMIWYVLIPMGPRERPYRSLYAHTTVPWSIVVLVGLVLTWLLNSVSLASYYYGTRKSALIASSTTWLLPDMGLVLWSCVAPHHTITWEVE
jgi:hypothetical protein